MFFFSPLWLINDLLACKPRVDIELTYIPRPSADRRLKTDNQQRASLGPPFNDLHKTLLVSVSSCSALLHVRVTSKRQVLLEGHKVIGSA